MSEKEIREDDGTLVITEKDAPAGMGGRQYYDDDEEKEELDYEIDQELRR